MSNEASNQFRSLTFEEKRRLVMFYEILMRIEQRETLKKAQSKKEVFDATA